MRKMFDRGVIVIVLVLAVAPQSLAKRRATTARDAWSVPQCTTVRGFPAVAMTMDGGATVLPFEETIEEAQIYTFGLAALPQRNQLLAVSGRLLLKSSDAGCTWSIDSSFTFPDHLYRLQVRGDAVWAWAIHNPQLFVLRNGVMQSRALPAGPISFSADLAFADDQGNIYWSDDDGMTWQLRATAPSRPPLYALELSPRTRLHAIATGLADGAFVTFDGGTTWTRSEGLSGLNVFVVSFSPVDTNVVWALGLNPPIEGEARRAIYRSMDGGRTFVKVLTGSEQVQLRNGFVFAPSPVDASLLYFALEGTTLYLIDGTGAIRESSQLPVRDINAVVFSPATPRVMYFGLKLSNMSAAAP